MPANLIFFYVHLNKPFSPRLCMSAIQNNIFFLTRLDRLI